MQTLIVDDDPGILDVLTQVVELSGHQVMACANAEDAWRILQTDEFPLIILDWMLPGMTGLELCRRIRTLPWGGQSQILIVTARLVQTSLHEALAAGADDYLAKPFDLAVLQLRLSIAERYIQSLAVRRQTERALQESNDQAAGVLIALRQALAAQEASTAALHASEERFRHSVDYSPIGMALVTPDGRFLQVNPALCTITGYAEDELLTTSLMALAHPDDRDSTRAFGRQLLAGTRSVVELETRYLHKGGQVVWIQLSASLMQTGESQPLYFMAQMQDITQRKQAVEALRESAQRLRAIVQTAPIMLIALDQAGCYTLTEGRGLALLGSAPNRLVGQSLFEAYPTLTAVHAAVRRALAGEEATARATLAGRLFETHYVPERDAEGAITGVIGVATDITERVQREEALQASEERFRLLAENATDIIARLTPQGIYLYVSPACIRLLGYAPDDLIGHAAAGFIHPEDRVIAAGAPAGSSAWPDSDSITCRLQHKEGHYLWFETIRRAIRDPQTGAVREVHTVSRDCTRRKQAEEALRQSEQHFRILLENAPVAACTVDHQNVFVTVNAAYCTLFGYTREEMVGQSTTLVYPRAQRPVTSDQIIERVYAQGHAEGQYTLATKAGRPLTVLATTIPITGPDGQPQHASFIVDITAQVQREQSLSHMAHYDALTGLPNRVLFHDSLHREMARAQRHGHLLALLYLDLDGFKEINDTRGHQAGDQLLHAVAQRLRACIRQSDTPARLGGDEFTVLLPDIQAPADAAAAAQKILASFAAGVRVGDDDLPVSASIGISVYPSVGQEGEDLLASADAAMYRAKEQGKNSYAFSAGALSGYSGSEGC